MTERELLLDCLRRLNRASLNYFLTGSMASNFWGIPRTTHDLDFVIQLPPSSVSKMMEAFGEDFFIDESAVRAASHLRQWAKELEVSSMLEEVLSGKIKPKET